MTFKQILHLGASGFAPAGSTESSPVDLSERSRPDQKSVAIFEPAGWWSGIAVYWLWAAACVYGFWFWAPVSLSLSIDRRAPWLVLTGMSTGLAGTLAVYRVSVSRKIVLGLTLVSSYGLILLMMSTVRQSVFFRSEFYIPPVNPALLWKDFKFLLALSIVIGFFLTWAAWRLAQYLEQGRENSRTDRTYKLFIVAIALLATYLLYPSLAPSFAFSGGYLRQVINWLATAMLLVVFPIILSQWVRPSPLAWFVVAFYLAAIGNFCHYLIFLWGDGLRRYQFWQYGAGFLLAMTLAGTASHFGQRKFRYRGAKRKFTKIATAVFVAVCAGLVTITFFYDPVAFFKAQAPDRLEIARMIRRLAYIDPKIAYVSADFRQMPGAPVQLKTRVRFFSPTVTEDVIRRLAGPPDWNYQYDLESLSSDTDFSPLAGLNKTVAVSFGTVAPSQVADLGPNLDLDDVAIAPADRTIQMTGNEKFKLRDCHPDSIANLLEALNPQFPSPSIYIEDNRREISGRDTDGNPDAQLQNGRISVRDWRAILEHSKKHKITIAAHFHPPWVDHLQRHPRHRIEWYVHPHVYLAKHNKGQTASIYTLIFQLPEFWRFLLSENGNDSEKPPPKEINSIIISYATPYGYYSTEWLAYRVNASPVLTFPYNPPVLEPGLSEGEARNFVAEYDLAFDADGACEAKWIEGIFYCHDPTKSSDFPLENLLFPETKVVVCDERWLPANRSIPPSRVTLPGIYHGPFATQAAPAIGLSRTRPNLEFLALPYHLEIDNLHFLAQIPNLKSLQFHPGLVDSNFRAADAPNLESLLLYRPPDATFLQEIARLKSLKRVVICLPPQNESEQFDRDEIRRALPEHVELTFVDNGEEYIEPHPWFERYLQSLRESVRTRLATGSDEAEEDVDGE